MVRLTRIYTRTGDDGSTGLADGSRRSKADLRVETYGTVDELNAAVGVALATIGSGVAFAGALQSIQHDLFDLGADLATPGAGEALRIVPEQVLRLEKLIDEYNAALSPLASFVLPGGSALAAQLHLARAICRRAERLAVALVDREGALGSVVPYLNRLSDLLFVLARVANQNGERDVLWQPGHTREL